MADPLKILHEITPSRQHLRSVTRTLVLAAGVGSIAGVGALAFYALSQAVAAFALQYLAGYHQHGPLNEAELFHVPTSPFRPWMLIVVPAIGGLLSGYIVYKFAPEAEGHGTDSAIDAYHNKRGYMRPIVPLIKMVASALTLGTGGSGGREGPIAQIGAGFGSHLGTRMGLADTDRRVLLAAGLGAGIGAIFHAPLAGAIFAIEVLYREADFEAEALIPAFLATTFAYCVFNFALTLGGYSEAFGHLFSVAPDIRFRQPMLLIPLTVLALVMIAASWMFVKVFYHVHWLFQRMSLRKWLKPGLGGALTGTIALMLYFALSPTGPDAQHDVLSVLAYGYGYLQELLLSPDGAGTLVVVMLAVAGGKMITTACTIGSGGSGGVFGPSVVIGGVLGGAVGVGFEQIMPDIVRVDVFVILGMAGFFAAAAKTPISSLIIVTEMTGSYELLLPAMWVCALAYLLSRGWSIFHAQVPTRIDSPAHRGEFVVDVLQGLSVADAMTGANRKFVTIPLEMPMSEVVRLITGTRQDTFPVVDDDGRFYGLFGLNDVRQFLYDAELGDLAVAHDLATPGDLALKLDMSLGEAIGQFASSRFDELPVVDARKPDVVIGMLRRRDVIEAYNHRLMLLRSSAEPATSKG